MCGKAANEASHIIKYILYSMNIFVLMEMTTKVA
jgi:hypothetical protein